MIPLCFSGGNNDAMFCVDVDRKRLFKCISLYILSYRKLLVYLPCTLSFETRVMTLLLKVFTVQDQGFVYVVLVSAGVAHSVVRMIL